MKTQDLPLYEPQADGSLKPVPKSRRSRVLKDEPVKLQITPEGRRQLVVLTPEEKAERQAAEEEARRREAEAEARAQARQSAIGKLAALGLTADEIAALLPGG